MNIDHVFICTPDAQRAERTLIDFGFHFGRRRIHSGQGTANACVFFDNAYFELLWANEDAELRSEVVRPLALWERTHWMETDASPFGIACRVEDGGIPVGTWPYEAPFLAAGATIPIVTPRFSTHEPLVFLQPGSRPPAAWPPEIRPPLEHCGKNRQLTAVTVCGPRLSGLSPGLRMLRDARVLALKPAAEHCLELVWDGAVTGGIHDFRPALPMVLRW